MVVGRDGRDISLWGPDVKPSPLWSTVVVGCCGVFCLVGGVCCGSVSSSDDEVEDDSEEESDESSGVDLSGGRSPSGSSRARVLGSGLWEPEDAPGCCGELSDTSIGGGSSICMCVAVLSSAFRFRMLTSVFLLPSASMKAKWSCKSCEVVMGELMKLMSSS